MQHHEQISLADDRTTRGRLLSAFFVGIVSLFLLAGCAGTVSEHPEKSASSASFAAPSVTTPTDDATDLADVPDYAGQDYIELNGGMPSFTEDDQMMEDGTEAYGELDDLGRATGAFAKLCTNTQPAPDSKREKNMPNPSGFVQAKYPSLNLDHLYERSHLIAYSLSDEAVNPRDLMTGTEHLNQKVMSRFEEEIRSYLKGGSADARHVLMRVTPDFRGNELVARGVQIEALSLEDDGAAIRINVYCYNIQPGVTIGYATGTSALEAPSTSADATQGIERTYVLNTNTKRFHHPNCDSATEMRPQNRAEETATRADLIARGYKPCGRCNP